MSYYRKISFKYKLERSKKKKLLEKKTSLNHQKDSFSCLSNSYIGHEKYFHSKNISVNIFLILDNIKLSQEWLYISIYNDVLTPWGHALPSSSVSLKYWNLNGQHLLKIRLTSPANSTHHMSPNGLYSLPKCNLKQWPRNKRLHIPLPINPLSHSVSTQQYFNKSFPFILMSC